MSFISLNFVFYPVVLRYRVISFEPDVIKVQCCQTSDTVKAGWV